MNWKSSLLGAADVLSGGLVSASVGQPPGTVAAAAVTADVADAVASRGSNQLSPKPGAAGGSAPKQQPECCPRYQISGDLLLETNTGRVWKYDQAKNTFVAVQKKLSHLDYWRTKLQLEDVLEGIHKEFDEEVLSKLPSAMKGDAKKKFVDDFVKVMQDELEKMKPGA
jgi:hypothetical protein